MSTDDQKLPPASFGGYFNRFAIKNEEGPRDRGLSRELEAKTYERERGVINFFPLGVMQSMYTRFNFYFRVLLSGVSNDVPSCSCIYNQIFIIADKNKVAGGLHGQESDLSTSLLLHIIQPMDNAIRPKAHDLPLHIVGNRDVPYAKRISELAAKSWAVFNRAPQQQKNYTTLTMRVEHSIPLESVSRRRFLSDELGVQQQKRCTIWYKNSWRWFIFL